MNGYVSAMRRYFEFGGRSSRAEFWIYFLVYIVILALAAVADAFLFGGRLDAQDGLGILPAIVTLIHFIPTLSVSFRRLHDTDRSAWWLLISFIPLVGAIWLLVLYCLPGTPGTNRFGPPTF